MRVRLSYVCMIISLCFCFSSARANMCIRPLPYTVSSPSCFVVLSPVSLLDPILYVGVSQYAFMGLPSYVVPCPYSYITPELPANSSFPFHSSQCAAFIPVRGIIVSRFMSYSSTQLFSSLPSTGSAMYIVCPCTIAHAFSM